MSPRTKSFSHRLSFLVVNVTSLLFLLAFCVVAYKSNKIIVSEATRSAENLLQATASDLDNIVGSVEATIANASWTAAEHLTDDDYLYHITQRTVQGDAGIVGSAIAFVPDYSKGRHWFSPYSWQDEKNGEVKSKQLGNARYDYFSMEWYTGPLESGKPCWSEPYADTGGGEMLMSTYSYPLKDADGNIYAVMTADLALSDIAAEIAKIKPYENSIVLLVSRDGHFISRAPHPDMQNITLQQAASLVNDNRLAQVSREMLAGHSGVSQYRNGRKTSFMVYGPLANGWSICISSFYTDVLKSIGELNLFMLVVGVLCLMLLFVMVYTLIKRLTRPLSMFSDTAGSIAEGNFDTVLPEVKRDDEIRQLRDSFATMQTSLKDYIRNLKETTAANERFESELNIARDIQMDMLPKNFPPRDVIDLHALLVPAKEVGGDLYDFDVSERSNSVYICVGDVSGKGVPAALVMSITKSSFKLLGTMNLDPAQLVSRVNDRLCEGNDAGMFVTLFLGRIDLATGEMAYCNAGHNPIVVIPPAKDAYFLDVKPNLAAGLIPGFPYEKQTVKFEKGTSLLLYTDGVTEAEDRQKNQYGEARLLEWATGEAHDSSCDSRIAAEDLLASIRQFTGDEPQNDDITIMTVKL